MAVSIAELSNRKLERTDIAMLEALAAAPKQTLRWEDRMDHLPTGEKGVGGRPVTRAQVIPGLQALVDDFCDKNQHLTVVPLKEETVRFRDGHKESYTPEPYIQRCTIARLESMVPDLIEHVGSPDEDSAKKPTRELRLTENGAKVLELWKEGRVAGVPYPDPEPTAVEPVQRESVEGKLDAESQRETIRAVTEPEETKPRRGRKAATA